MSRSYRKFPISKRSSGKKWKQSTNSNFRRHAKQKISKFMLESAEEYGLCNSACGCGCCNNYEEFDYLVFTLHYEQYANKEFSSFDGILFEKMREISQIYTSPKDGYVVYYGGRSWGFWNENGDFEYRQYISPFTGEIGKLDIIPRYKIFSK